MVISGFDTLKKKKSHHKGAFQTSLMSHLLKFHWQGLVSRPQSAQGSMAKGRRKREGNNWPFFQLLHVAMEIDKNWPTFAPGELLPVRVQIPLSIKRISSIMKFILVGNDLL